MSSALPQAGSEELDRCQSACLTSATFVPLRLSMWWSLAEPSLLRNGLISSVSTQFKYEQ